MNTTLKLKHVYENPVFQAMDPRGKHFLEARWLPPELNAFAKYGIKVAALIPFATYAHIKAPMAVQIMLEDFEAGRYEGKHTIVVDSSGNTAHSVARLAPAFGFETVKVMLAMDVPESKKGMIAALPNVELIEVESKKVGQRAMEEGERPGHYYLNQYSHMGNMNAHELYTGPEVLRTLGENIAFVAIAMGTGGTAGGVGSFFKKTQASSTVLGVRLAHGQRVPGARDEQRMRDRVTLPWAESVTSVIEMSRKESFIRMRRLWSAVEPQPGPSSGLAWGGLEQYLDRFSPQILEGLRGRTAGFICPDGAAPYSERTSGELDTDQGFENQGFGI